MIEMDKQILRSVVEMAIELCNECYFVACKQLEEKGREGVSWHQPDIYMLMCDERMSPLLPPKEPYEVTQFKNEISALQELVVQYKTARAVLDKLLDKSADVYLDEEEVWSRARFLLAYAVGRDD